MFDSQTFAPPPSVPAIIMNESQEWNSILTKIVALDTKEKASALEMGDEFIKIEERWGKVRVKEAAEYSGIEYATARQRAWVSKKIPKDHSLRSSHLSYTHLRDLATLPEGQMEEWTNKTLENAWSPTRLRAEIAEAGIKGEKPPTAVGICIECEKQLPTEGEKAEQVVRWSMGDKKASCCSPKCAAVYFVDYGDKNEQPQ